VDAADDSFVPPPLHELESEVMEEVWDRGSVTVRAILEALNGRGQKQRAYTTIMTIMQRLDEKGLLRRCRQGKTDVYEACMSREGYLQARAAAEVGALVEQYGDEAFVNFARHMASLDPERRRQLNRLARRG
jgi:predicted transcriptional regulator